MKLNRLTAIERHPQDTHHDEPDLASLAMTLKVTLGHQYGQQIVHPACDKTRLFCEIAGTKTMPRLLVEQVKRLGYRVEVLPSEPKEL